MSFRFLLTLVVVVSLLAVPLACHAQIAPGPELAEQTRAQAAQMIAKAESYLRSVQDKASGGWAVNPNGPTFPAITGLVVSGVAMSLSFRGDPATDPALASAVAFILSKQQPDGGIYDQILPSYNTSICLSALARINTPEAKAAAKKAQDFLRSLQYSETSVFREKLDESSKPVDKDHPFYGGVGYGRHGRPDLSNLSWMLEGLHESGVPGDDPAFQRAVVFLQRLQMTEKGADGKTINSADYARGSHQGGFIYATSVNKDEVGSGQSQAGSFEETLSDGTIASRLRAYGSMTYAGFKSYVYANLGKNDPRVIAAREWISRNYTLKENPGMGTDGMYYYYVTFAKAMDAFGEPLVPVVGADGSMTARDWRNDLIEQLATLQEPDGSFTSVDDRWMEDNKTLITAYALLALRHATK